MPMQHLTNEYIRFSKVESLVQRTHSITEPRHTNPDNTNSSLLSRTQKCHEAHIHKAHYLWQVRYKNNLDDKINGVNVLRETERTMKGEKMTPWLSQLL